MTDEISPDAFAAFNALLKVITEPAAYKKRLTELSEKTAAHKAAAELSRQERAAADAKLAELGTRQAALDEREDDVDAKERRLEMKLHEAEYPRYGRDADEDRRTAAAAAEGILRPAHLRERGFYGDAHFRAVPDGVFKAP